MFDCRRCKNTGQITEQYADHPPLKLPMSETTPAQVEIKLRQRECPDCLGFSTVPLRHKRGYGP